VEADRRGGAAGVIKNVFPALKELMKVKVERRRSTA
jgi:hypothetical protein